MLEHRTYLSSSSPGRTRVKFAFFVAIFFTAPRNPLVHLPAPFHSFSHGFFSLPLPAILSQTLHRVPIQRAFGLYENVSLYPPSGRHFGTTLLLPPSSRSCFSKRWHRTSRRSFLCESAPSRACDFPFIPPPLARIATLPCMYFPREEFLFVTYPW